MFKIFLQHRKIANLFFHIFRSDPNDERPLCVDRAFACHTTIEDMARETQRKSLEDLRQQWAGGRDAWLNVPLTTDTDNKEFLPVLLTRIQKPQDSSTNASQWPRIVQNSIAFGLSAYNPRGQELPLEVNQNRQAKLNEDLLRAKSNSELPLTVWDAIGIWEDGSAEPGFILAVPCSMEKEGLALSSSLAKKYDQGAIYRFKLDPDGVMVRDTIGVCDPGCEAQAHIEIDIEASEVEIQALLKSVSST